MASIVMDITSGDLVPDSGEESQYIAPILEISSADGRTIFSIDRLIDGSESENPTGAS